MPSRTPYVLVACLLTPPVVADQAAPEASSASPEVQEEHRFTNLEVLPKDISKDDLSAVMLGNLRGLGLPRRQSQGCLFCHVGDPETPRDSWDMASDGKPEKRKAREMMAMTADINRRLAGLEDRLAPNLEVTCYTCHAGRTDPRPLPVRLRASYESGGAGGLAETYRDLRERYYGADAYDFRPGVLSGVAFWVILEDLDAAIAVFDKWLEAHPEHVMARRRVATLRAKR